MDCGPSSLRMVAKYYSKNYSLQSLRSKSYVTRSGVSMLGISNAAEEIGFCTLGYRLSWEQLRDEVALPCIAHWNQHHFVVIYDIKKQRSIPNIFNRTSREGLNANRSISYLIYVADPVLTPQIAGPNLKNKLGLIKFGNHDINTKKVYT